MCSRGVFGVLILAAWLACPAPASAAPAYAQAPVCNSASTAIALGSPPNNGDVVVAVAGSTTTLVALTMVDSNSVAYTRERNPGVTAAWMALFDHAVSGSPTGAYTFSAAVTACIYDLSGVSSTGAFAATQATSSGATASQSLSTVVSDLMICGVSDATHTPSAITTSHGALTMDNVTALLFVGHGTANAIATTSCTATVTAGDNLAIIFADYPAGSGGGGGGGIPAGWIGGFIPAPSWQQRC